MKERLGNRAESAGTDEDSVIKSPQPHEQKISFLQQPASSLVWGNRVLASLSSLGIRCRKHRKLTPVCLDGRFQGGRLF
jgi:hypothetical protein